MGWLAGAVGLFFSGLAGSLAVGLSADSAIAQIPTAADSLQAIDQINIFGDSLSDAGNIFALTQGAFPPSPPYAQRLSNGPVWVEAIAAELGLSPALSVAAVPPALAGIAAPPADGINFAVSGSLSSDVNVGGPPLPGLQQQVAVFSALSQAGAAPSENALHILLVGGNDYNQAVASAMSMAELSGLANQVSGLANQVTDNIVGAAAALIEAGAKNLLVSNLPALGLQPLADSINQPFPPGSAIEAETLLSDLSTRHNQLLDQKLTALETALDGSDVTLTQFDFEALSVAIAANPGEFGFDNVEDSCLSNFQPTGIPTVCANPDSFFFWDDIHPTEAGHAVVAQAALQTLAQSLAASPANLDEDAASVPEPVSVLALLVFGGVLCLFVQSRREPAKMGSGS